MQTRRRPPTRGACVSTLRQRCPPPGRHLQLQCGRGMGGRGRRGASTCPAHVSAAPPLPTPTCPPPPPPGRAGPKLGDGEERRGCHATSPFHWLCSGVYCGRTASCSVHCDRSEHETHGRGAQSWANWLSGNADNSRGEGLECWEGATGLQDFAAGLVFLGSGRKRGGRRRQTWSFRPASVTCQLCDIEKGAQPQCPHVYWGGRSQCLLCAPQRDLRGLS